MVKIRFCASERWILKQEIHRCCFFIIFAFLWRESYQSSVIIVRDESCDPCYRKLLVGKRLPEHHVRRSFQCDRIEECHRMCEYESSFVCEGFNYGRMHRNERQGYMCQLTSIPTGTMDVRRDFVADSRYDYYERDWRCPAEKPGGNNWSNDPRQPLYPHRSPLPPINHPTNELPRPINQFPITGVSNTGYYLPEKSRPPINRPNDYDYYSRPLGYLPERPPINFQYHRPQYDSNNNYHQSQYPVRPYGGFSKYPDRRIDQNGWQRPNEVLHRDWQKPNSGSYGPPHHSWPVTPVYGPSYGYHTNNYPGEVPKKGGGSFHDYGINKPGKRPSSEDDYYGYHYGPGYSYGDHGQGQHPVDSYAPSSKPQLPDRWKNPGNWGGSRDCSVRSATGFKLDRRCVSASYVTANLEECEMLCSKNRGCQSFAYRYSLAPTAPTDNCLLSNVNLEKLNFYTDLVPDRDYDIYAMMNDRWKCEESRKPSTSVQNRPPEECFWRVRSGLGMPRSLTRKEYRANGIGECQIACISIRHFTCRSFVFRYESSDGRGSNCFLSDCPTSEVIQAAGNELPYVNEAELFERGSYGRGCEPDPFGPIYNPASIDKQPQWSGTRIVNRGDEGSCYSGYLAGCKLSPYAVSSTMRADSENECRRKCSKMRNSQHSPCMSFSYKIGDEKRGDNCYLSDVPRRDLRPGLDYTYDDDYVMYAWKELEPQCSTIGPAAYPNPGLNGLYQNPPINAARPPINGQPPLLGTGNGFISYNHLLLDVRPLESDGSDPIGPADNPSSSVSHQNDGGYSYGMEPYPNGFASFNRHYTVNGYPCKRGTKCEKNHIVGFWSCEPEGAELGSWDYCCEPNNHCGFSQGYRYPWCYVGSSEDQWRPCSERYLPYLPSPRPTVRPPSRPNNHGPLNHHHYQTINDQDPSTYHSRHWPIIFVHPIPPPNATDSVALPNDRRDDQHTTTDVAETSETPQQSSDIINSSITRLQLHKSHLKRRGLLSGNRTRINNRTKSSEKKIHRIVIIPASFDNETDVTSKSSNEGNTLERLNYYNSTENIETNKNEESKDDRDANTGIREVNRRKAGLGRIERVTKPTFSSRSSTVDSGRANVISSESSVF